MRSLAAGVVFSDVSWKEDIMKKFMITALILLFLPYGILCAQNLSGTYATHQDGQTITVSLAQDADGRVTGTMNSEGIEYTIKGQRQGDRITGFLNAFDESLEFSAQFTNNNLLITFFDPTEERSEGKNFSETLVFRRLEHRAPASQNETSASGKSKSQEASIKAKVIINGVVLSEKQIAELEQIYKVKPLPGKYWYDARSGLYGVVGFPAYGFMLAGHDYGNLEKSASNGNTGVFVNGRELPQSEWAVWSQLLGYMIQPGKYWLDDNGNAGYEGNPIPTENLFMAAQRNNYRGSGSGRDNFWSSRFSAGNYDSGNQRGYVSVPGHGPIGYGF
jgi:hypothetical protein